MNPKERDPLDGRIYQLKLSLQDAEPSIWRRVLVSANATLVELHRVIQAAMGWENQHLWRFQARGAEYSEAPAAEWSGSMREAGGVTLGEIARTGDVLLYEYDFGDSWKHRIQVEAVRSPSPGQAHPVCTDAERACPPEDCGGVPGYDALLEVLADPADPDHDSLREWLGAPFDPEAVSVEDINRHLARTQSDAGGGGHVRTGFFNSGNSAEAAVRELRARVEDLLQDVIAENPEAAVAELNAALQATASGYNLRPQPELGGLSPAQMQRLLSADWESPSGAIQLNRSLSLEELEGSRTLCNARQFLQLLRDRGLVKATPKGNLPREFVAAIHEAMQQPERADWWGAGPTVRNEGDIFPLHLLRILLELSGLIKRRKGFFSLTRAGERLSSDARAGELFTLLFVTHFRRLNLAYLDGVEPLPGFQYTVAYALYRFGEIGVQWKQPLQLKADLVLPAVLDELPPGEYHDSWETVLNHRLLQPLEGFALSEVRTLPRIAGAWRDRREYRKSALFDDFLRFGVTAV